MTEAPKALNLELLIKLLKLSASDNDAEALLALRKATEVLKKFGGDWEALLHGKVTVIADPFTTAAAPPPEVHHRAAPPAPAPRRPAPQPAPRPQRPYQSSWAAQDAAALAASKARLDAQQKMKAAAAHATPAQPAAASRNTLRKQRVSLDDLA